MKRDRLTVGSYFDRVKNRCSMAVPLGLLPVCLMLIGFSLVVSTLVYVFLPGSRELITLEDSLVENCSALLFISTFFLSSLKALSRKGRNSKLYILSCVSLLGFLDEVSFGERLFSLSMPTLSGKKIDAIHDLADVAKNYILRYASSHPKMGALALGGLIGFSIFVLWKWNAEIRSFSAHKLKNRSVVFASLFVACGLIATLLDLELVYSEYLFALEEVLEMDAALCLFFLGLSL